ncbi:unnamed protein product [Brassica oleracea]|uniref:(rape) hypothetical protein n=1 Tax=Brassica napus TaxID=3708 RepID=A0A816I190_BRANA|nr:unnamed protein product [Brassica napus]
MVSALRFFTCLVLAVCIVASVDAAISCDTVVSSLGPCYFYLRQGGIVPPSCCGGVRNLNGVAAVTSATRIRFALGGTIYNAWVPKRAYLQIFLCKARSATTNHAKLLWTQGLTCEGLSPLGLGPDGCLGVHGSFLKWTETGQPQSFSCLHTPCCIGISNKNRHGVPIKVENTGPLYCHLKGISLNS